MSRFQRALALVLAASLGTFSVGCFGKFALVRAIYKANDSIGNKFAKSLVTWVFVIVPVYAVAALIDFVIFNLIEFWGGSNPIGSGPQTRVYASGDQRFEMTTEALPGGGTKATVRVYERGTLIRTMVIDDNGKGKVVSQASGQGGDERRVAELVPNGGLRVESSVEGESWISPSAFDRMVTEPSSSWARLARERAEKLACASASTP